MRFGKYPNCSSLQKGDMIFSLQIVQSQFILEVWTYAKSEKKTERCIQTLLGMGEVDQWGAQHKNHERGVKGEGEERGMEREKER